LIWLAVTAFAAVTPPSYELMVVQEAMYALNQEMDLADDATDSAERREHLIQSVDFSGHFQRLVTQSAMIERIKCIALQQLDLTGEALDSCLHATTLPLHGLASWTPFYQLGIVQLKAGKFVNAKESFQASVQRMDPSKTDVEWRQLAHMKLAKLAAQMQDSAMLDQSLKAAMKAGYSLDLASCDPEWRQLYSVETNRKVLDRIFSVYSEPRSLERLRGAVECP